MDRMGGRRLLGGWLGGALAAPRLSLLRRREGGLSSATVDCALCWTRRRIALGQPAWLAPTGRSRGRSRRRHRGLLRSCRPSRRARRPPWLEKARWCDSPRGAGWCRAVGWEGWRVKAWGLRSGEDGECESVAATRWRCAVRRVGLGSGSPPPPPLPTGQGAPNLSPAGAHFRARPILLGL